ncbi:MAG: hypothetical protein K2P38_08185, partial [Lachnospiraceae bacterium]|nr:hypothetical protein [Lachnospiraceae bacterium]
MNDTMYHRGPDDHGVSLYQAGKGYSVGMAQRRLAIMDLSPLGHQPMESADGQTADSNTHLPAHQTTHDLQCRLLLQ